MKILFPLGKVAITPGALQILAGDNLMVYLRAHQSGNWGVISPKDARENDLAVAKGLRILSAYRTLQGQEIWVITEADRSLTTILLPEEY